MRIDVIQSSSTMNNEFDILYDGKLRYKSRLPFVTIKEPLELEKIREIKVYDLNGHEVYSTDYKYVENKVEEFIPFKFLVTGSQKFNQLLFTSKTNNIKVYFEEKEIWKNRYVIEMDGKKYFCYSVEDGYIRHFPVYDGEKQVGEILKSNVVIDAKDEYCCYLKDEYKNIADGIVALLLYLDRSQYSSSYLVNKSLVLEKRYSYNKNNKYYDGDWVKNNFGNEYYEKVDNDINKVKSIIKSPKKLWDYQWKSLNKKDKILMVIAVFGVWIIMAIVLIALLIGFAVNKIKSNDNDTNASINDNTTDNPNAKVIDIQEYVSSSKGENNYIDYSINLKKVYEDYNLSDESLKDANVKLKYKIDNYDILLKLSSSTGWNYPLYDVYVNGKYIYNDHALWDPQITLFYDYIIFRDNGTTNIRSLHLYIVNKDGNLNELYELDSSNSGMRGNEFNIADNKLSIKGYRMTHGASVVYNGHADDGYYSLSNKNGCDHALNELSDDFLIEAVYSYKYENGILNTTPELSEKVTLKEYIEKYNLCK